MAFSKGNQAIIPTHFLSSPYVSSLLRMIETISLFLFSFFWANASPFPSFMDFYLFLLIHSEVSFLHCEVIFVLELRWEIPLHHQFPLSPSSYFLSFFLFLKKLFFVYSKNMWPLKVTSIRSWYFAICCASHALDLDTLPFFPLETSFRPSLLTCEGHASLSVCCLHHVSSIPSSKANFIDLHFVPSSPF